MPTFTTDTVPARLFWQGEIWHVPVRWHDAEVLRGDHAPAGYFLDWQSDEARAMVHAIRTSGDRMPHQDIAATYGFQHWIRSYRAGDAEARRRQRELARSGAPHAGRQDHRAYSRRSFRNAPAAPARPGSRPDTSLTGGRFGIEIEFNLPHGADRYDNTIQRDVVAACREQGIAAQQEGYNHTTQPHWKMTSDATVSGGEMVSPIMAGDTASLDEVRDVLRAIKAAGGVTGRNVGMHVHHDVTHFTTADERENLVDVLEAVETALSKYVTPVRLTGEVSCSAPVGTTYDWQRLRIAVRDIVPGSRPNGYHDYGTSGVTRYRFFNLEGPMHKYGTVEFRGLGGTLHAGKVRVWVRMGQAIIAFAKAGLTVPADTTPESLVALLQDHGLIGRRTGEKFLAECERRQG